LRISDVLEARHKEVSEALLLLESHPAFPRLELAMLDRLKETEKNLIGEASVRGHPARLKCILERYDIRAQTFLELVTDVARQNAFITTLGWLESAAWEEFTGYPPEVTRPASGQAHADLDSIRARKQQWIYKGYQRLAAARGTECTGSHHYPTTQSGATDWQDIEIEFLSDERVQIRIGQRLETCNYSEMGFKDRRSGKPNLAWITLRLLAEQGGTIKVAEKDRTWEKVEKRIQGIRKSLRCYFELSSDPLPFVKGGGFRARFKIHTGPSYER